jgi:UDP-N-acetyl-D-galactosamine dehydrogenase
MNHKKRTIAVIGLGYVGLPLAVEFGRTRPVIGFDIKAGRTLGFNDGHEPHLEALGG